MEDQITQYIQNILQREPAPGEVDGWIAIIEGNVATLEEVRQMIIDTAEAVTNVYPMVLTYQAIYGRVPDADGLEYWTNVYASNLGLDDPATTTVNEALVEVLKPFVDPAQTPEFIDRYGANPTGDQFVAAAYQNVLNRVPDQDGLTYWQTRYAQIEASYADSGMTQDEITVQVRAEILEQFVNSAEYKTATAEEVDAYLTARAEGEDVSGSLWDLDPDANVGQTFVLTTGADAPVGTAGNDTFVATEASLSSADVLDGGAGTDTLRYASSGAAAVNEAGFEASNIETVQVTSDATGGTAFDVTGVTELQTLRNFNSSEGLNLVGMDRLVAVELQSVGSAGAGANDPTPDTALTFNAAVVAGNADALSVKLNGNLNVDGSGVGDLNVAGIEIVNVTTEGAASSMNSIASGSLRAMTIAGDQNLTLAAANFFDAVNVNTVNASAFTGNLNLTLTNDNAATIDVAVTGGTGNDTVTFQSFDTNDAFNGGDGIDTIGLTNAVATARTPVNGGTLSNVEQLNVTTLGTGTIDMDAFPGVTKVIYDAGLTNAALSTVADAASGITVEVDTLAGGTGNLTVALKTDGTADVVTIELDGIAAGHSVGTLTAADAETLNISADDDTVAGNGAVTIANLALTDTTALNLSGDADLTIAAATNPATPVLATVNASAATGNLNITGLNTAAAGATITLGSGDDVFNVATSNGADTITLGLGRDTIVYNAVAQSDRDMDTITDFVSGTDIVDVRALMGGVGVASSVQFVSNRATFAQAQGALSGVTADAVFQVDEQILWVDIDRNGTLDNNDFRIKLDGVTAITAADLGFTAGVTFTANQAAFNTATAAHSQENNAVGTEDDTINATVAQLVGSTVNGLGGTDVLNISGTAALGEIADLRTIAFTNVETINLAATVEGVDMDAADLGAGQVTRINGVSGTVQSLTVNTGSNISGVTLSNIEVLNATGAVTMTAAQHNAFQQINAAGGADSITLTTAGTVTADDDIETYSIVEGSTITVGTSAAGLARVVDETGVVGTASTIILGNGTYTGVYTGIDATDVVRVGTTTDVSANTGFDAGAVIDFQNTATAAAGLTLNNTQNGVVTFTNTTGAQTVTVNGAADTFTVANGIESYDVIGGSVVTVSATNTAVNIDADNTAASTVAVAGNTVTGNYVLAHANDVISATDGANIAGVNGGAVTTAESLTLTGGITMTAAQYIPFSGAGTITAAGGADSVTLTTSSPLLVGDAAVESYVLNGAGADTIAFDEVTDPALTDAVRVGQSVDLAGGGADKIVIDNAAVINGADSSITITNFGADDVISTFVSNVAASNGVYFNNYAGVPTAIATGSVVEIDAASFQFGVASNTAAVLGWLTAAGVTGAAGSEIATVIAYNGAGQAAIYQVEETNSGAGAFDTIELIGIVNAADNSLVGANFA